MPDREKVRKGLEICLGKDSCYGCPYDEECRKDKTHTVLLKDALAMLKEQEAVKPTLGHGKPFCGACGLQIRGGKFCSECGKPIAWKGQ